MPEDLSEELRAESAGFAAALPASVEMPAGAGKTHLVAATARYLVGDGGKVLVLTHTNAGVYAIDARLKRFGVTKGAHVATITSFAFKLARAYPELGNMRVPKVMNPPDSKKYVECATQISATRHIQDVIAASFTHVLVDEYQDCNEAHHELVLNLKAAVPMTGILGDPLQAIFGFSDKLPDWAEVISDFPPFQVDHRPRRWVDHNEALGDWLLKVRAYLSPGRQLNLATANFPPGVTFTNIAGDTQGVTSAALATRPADETVLIIAAWPNTARDIAGHLNGSFTVMEEIAGKFMAERLTDLIDADRSDYALWMFDLTKACHCGHGVLDTQTLRKRYLNGKTGGDLSRPGAEPAIRAFDRVLSAPTLTNLAAAMNVIPTAPALRLHSHEAWYDIQTAIRGAIANANDTTVLLEELAKARDVLRYAGRRERMRIVSRTLLVKGLEYDHVIIANIADHRRVNDFYVALSRARKTITILGTSNTVTLIASPNGPS
jgi:superfamily I DNA/RNA helicase